MQGWNPSSVLLKHYRVTSAGGRRRMAVTLLAVWALTPRWNGAVVSNLILTPLAVTQANARFSRAPPAMSNLFRSFNALLVFLAGCMAVEFVCTKNLFVLRVKVSLERRAAIVKVVIANPPTLVLLPRPQKCDEHIHTGAINDFIQTIPYTTTYYPPTRTNPEAVPRTSANATQTNPQTPLSCKHQSDCYPLWPVYVRRLVTILVP